MESGFKKKGIPEDSIIMDAKPVKDKNVFTSRNFRLVFFGALVSELGALLYSFAVSFYILEITDNNAFLQGLYLALNGVAMLVFTPIGGVLGDRFNKAKIMYICDYSKGSVIILATVLMLLFPASSAHVAILFVLGIISNAISGVFNPTSGSLFPQIVEESKLQQANSYFSVKNALEGILGIVLAGVLYATVPIYILFFFVGACFVASGFSEMFILYEHKAPSEQLTLKVAFGDIREGLVYLKSQKAIIVMMSAILFINFFFAPISGNFLPYFVKTDIANASSYLFDNVLKPELWSSVFSVCFGLSSLLGALILSAKPQADKVGRKSALRFCIMAGLMIAMTILYHIFVYKNVWLNGFILALCLGCLLIGFLIANINISISTALMRIVDKDKLSKMTSITSIGTQSMVPIASVLAGIILNNLGSTFLLAFCSLGFTTTAVLLLFNKHTKEV